MAHSATIEGNVEFLKFLLVRVQLIESLERNCMYFSRLTEKISAFEPGFKQQRRKLV